MEVDKMRSFVRLFQRGSTFLTDLKCQTDRDCVHFENSVCHPGAGFCTCPGETVLVVQEYACRNLAKDLRNAVCQSCVRRQGTCYRSAKLGSRIQNEKPLQQTSFKPVNNGTDSKSHYGEPWTDLDENLLLRNIFTLESVHPLEPDEDTTLELIDLLTIEAYGCSCSAPSANSLVQVDAPNQRQFRWVPTETDQLPKTTTVDVTFCSAQLGE
ncbi:hypothetical protein PHET_06469 [Paragonimus heterotremus]|uniref:Uncharacterized protein n=1 Tax=Paragonimus heterotremus TaxID=100268 RepID=A0A8J4SKH0_9TREM|nr:hypothetical protein PHET_06469 [Paragonimus heterotremus]